MQLSTNAWHQITVSVTTGDMEIYLDGSLVDSAAMNPATRRIFPPGTGLLAVGNNSYWPWESMDDFQLFDSVLTAPQVNALYLGAATDSVALPTTTAVQIASGSKLDLNRHQPNCLRVVRL